MTNPKAYMLIVEDSDEDYYATERTLKKSGVANTLVRCEDGEKAIHYLYRQGEFSHLSNDPLPNIILLDLNLPKMDGRDVLAKIKNDPNLKKIPVVVFTTSTNEKDIKHCYEYGANSYIQKPVDLEGLMKAIQRLKDYWFEIVVLPVR